MAGTQLAYETTDDMTRLQCLAARAMLEWTQVDLAREAGVSHMTVRGFERGETAAQRSTLAVIQLALEKAGIEFNADGRGVRLREPE
jgi:transcriptional regulator with XRE-family HTH domain